MALPDETIFGLIPTESEGREITVGQREQNKKPKSCLAARVEQVSGGTRRCVR